MRLSANDYKHIIYNRLDKVKELLYSQRYQGIYPGAPAAVPADEVPNFDTIRALLSESIELLEEYETSIGPA